MKAELIPKVVEALESGRYKQTKGVLRQTFEGETCYCIDGVILDVIDPNGWTKAKGWEDWRSDNVHIEGWISLSQFILLGFDERIAVSDHKGSSKPTSPWRMNDFEGWTFADFCPPP